MKSATRCSVCLRQFSVHNSGQTPAQLPCGHNICYKCLQTQWLTSEHNDSEGMDCIQCSIATLKRKQKDKKYLENTNKDVNPACPPSAVKYNSFVHSGVGETADQVHVLDSKNGGDKQGSGPDIQSHKCHAVRNGEIPPSTCQGLHQCTWSCPPDISLQREKITSGVSQQAIQNMQPVQHSRQTVGEETIFLQSAITQVSPKCLLEEVPGRFMEITGTQGKKYKSATDTLTQNIVTADPVLCYNVDQILGFTPLQTTYNEKTKHRKSNHRKLKHKSQKNSEKSLEKWKHHELNDIFRNSSYDKTCEDSNLFIIDKFQKSGATFKQSKTNSEGLSQTSNFCFPSPSKDTAQMPQKIHHITVDDLERKAENNNFDLDLGLVNTTFSTDEQQQSDGILELTLQNNSNDTAESCATTTQYSKSWMDLENFQPLASKDHSTSKDLKYNPCSEQEEKFKDEVQIALGLHCQRTSQEQIMNSSVRHTESFDLDNSVIERSGDLFYDPIDDSDDEKLVIDETQTDLSGHAENSCSSLGLNIDVVNGNASCIPKSEEGHTASVDQVLYMNMSNLEDQIFGNIRIEEKAGGECKMSSNEKLIAGILSQQDQNIIKSFQDSYQTGLICSKLAKDALKKVEGIGKGPAAMSAKLLTGVLNILVQQAELASSICSEVFNNSLSMERHLSHVSDDPLDLSLKSVRVKNPSTLPGHTCFDCMSTNKASETKPKKTKQTTDSEEVTLIFEANANIAANESTKKDLNELKQDNVPDLENCFKQSTGVETVNVKQHDVMYNRDLTGSPLSKTFDKQHQTDYRLKVIKQENCEGSLIRENDTAHLPSSCGNNSIGGTQNEEFSDLVYVATKNNKHKQNKKNVKPVSDGEATSKDKCTKSEVSHNVDKKHDLSVSLCGLGEEKDVELNNVSKIFSNSEVTFNSHTSKQCTDSFSIIGHHGSTEIQTPNQGDTKENICHFGEITELVKICSKSSMPSSKSLYSAGKLCDIKHNEGKLKSVDIDSTGLPESEGQSGSLAIETDQKMNGVMPIRKCITRNACSVSDKQDNVGKQSQNADNSTVRDVSKPHNEHTCKLPNSKENCNSSETNYGENHTPDEINELCSRKKDYAIKTTNEKENPKKILTNGTIMERTNYQLTTEKSNSRSRNDACTNSNGYEKVTSVDNDWEYLNNTAKQNQIPNLHSNTVVSKAGKTNQSTQVTEDKLGPCLTRNTPDKYCTKNMRKQTSVSEKDTEFAKNPMGKRNLFDSLLLEMEEGLLESPAKYRKLQFGKLAESHKSEGEQKSIRSKTRNQERLSDKKDTGSPSKQRRLNNKGKCDDTDIKKVIRNHGKQSSPGVRGGMASVANTSNEQKLIKNPQCSKMQHLSANSMQDESGCKPKSKYHLSCLSPNCTDSNGRSFSKKYSSRKKCKTFIPTTTNVSGEVSVHGNMRDVSLQTDVDSTSNKTPAKSKRKLDMGERNEVQQEFNSVDTQETSNLKNPKSNFEMESSAIIPRHNSASEKFSTSQENRGSLENVPGIESENVVTKSYKSNIKTDKTGSKKMLQECGPASGVVNSTHSMPSDFSVTLTSVPLRNDQGTWNCSGKEREQNTDKTDNRLPLTLENENTCNDNDMACSELPYNSSLMSTDRDNEIFRCLSSDGDSDDDVPLATLLETMIKRNHATGSLEFENDHLPKLIVPCTSKQSRCHFRRSRCERSSFNTFLEIRKSLAVTSPDNTVDTNTWRNSMMPPPLEAVKKTKSKEVLSETSRDDSLLQHGLKDSKELKASDIMYESEGGNRESSNRKKKISKHRRRKSENPVASSSSEECIPPARKRGFRLKQECLKILDRVYNHEFSDPFRHEIKSKDVPDYYKVIKRGMCFDIIGYKLRGNIYEELKEFFLDINLVFENCFLYHSPDSPIYRAGQIVKCFFRKIAKQILMPRKTAEKRKSS